MSNQFNSAIDTGFPDMCRVRETILMLNLAIAQISGAMKDGDDSVNVLTNSFTSMMTSVQDIGQLAERLPEGDEQREIGQNCAAVIGQMQGAIMAFQFYDKLSQRLNHLTNGLASFSELVGSPELINNPDAWDTLQEDIKSKYTLEADKAMFDAILQGKSVEEALQQLTSHNEETSDEIELF